jgi:hypothetical protein
MVDAATLDAALGHVDLGKAAVVIAAPDDAAGATT